MEDKMGDFGDWALPNPSPRTFMSNLLNEELGSKSFSSIFENNKDSEMEKMAVKPKQEAGEDEFDFSKENYLEPKSFDVQSSSSRGGLAQRIAKAGFNFPKINTSSIKSGNFDSSKSEIRSPYLTIPPGLSPTTLLDSPVFLSNSMAQPSPTTGKLSIMCNGTNSLLTSASDTIDTNRIKDSHNEDIVPGGFTFKTQLNTSSPFFSSQENKPQVSVQHDFKFHASFSESSPKIDNTVDNDSNEHSPLLEDQTDVDGGTKGEFENSLSTPALAEDGYNWRKYGQKQVKGSEYPRSYYKCTHPNCQVKKKVERSLEGIITEITYNGAHNHEKPLVNRRSGTISSELFNDARVDGSEANYVSTQLFGNPSVSVHTHDGAHFDSPEAIEVSSSVSNDNEVSIAVGGDGEEEESESKRMKVDACAVEMNTSSRAAREPRVVVQTTSEVDILDDGYRWRKYGQKVVKGNPNPRSYYKCTSIGCTVRKHVERASHDLKSVITTYEGKHNHEVPAARNSSHSSSAHSTASASMPTQHPKQEPTLDGLMDFNRHGIRIGPMFNFGAGPPDLTNFRMGRMCPVPINSYNMGLVAGSNGSAFVEPKMEPNGEANSNRLAVYQQLMSRLPLGPQM